MWFVPNSRIDKLTLETLVNEVATRTPESLLDVAKTITDYCSPPLKRSVDFLVNKKVDNYSQSIRDAFTLFGSDKSIEHDYHNIYAQIILSFNRPLRILEIGLGSQNKNIASHMSSSFKPGGSLRAFRSLLPNSTIHGADIDKEICIEGFKIFNIDQTKSESFSVIKSGGEVNYDLIIDDGLHSPDANLNTLNFALSSIGNDGVIIIEDIPERSLAIWEIVQILFQNSNYRTLLVKDRESYLFLCTPKASGKIMI